MLAGLEAQWVTDGRYVDLVPYNSFDSLDRVVSDPSEFGFTGATSPCYLGFVNERIHHGHRVVCSNPDEHVFFDKEHPTSALHDVLAREMLGFMREDLLDYLSNIVSGVRLSTAMSTRLQALLANARILLAHSAAGNDGLAVQQLQNFIGLVGLYHEFIGDDAAGAFTDGAEKIISLI